MTLNVQHTEPARPSSAPPRRVPIVRGLPVVGALPEFLSDPPHTLARYARAHQGEIFGLRLGPMTLYVVSHPDHVQQVLHDPHTFTKGGRIWDSSRQVIGNGLVTSEGDFWLRQRRLMQPLFNAAHLASLVDTMVDVVEREVERLAAFARTGEAFDVIPEMMQLIQRVLLATMFGTSISAGETARLIGDIDAVLHTIALRMFLNFVSPRIPLPGDRRFTGAVARIDATMMRLVAERRRSGAKGDDLLSLLVRVRDDGAEEGMTDRQIRDELVTMLLAGNETNATALTWTWYVLAQHPEVAHDVREEVDAVLGDRRPTYADLDRLVYTRQVLLETMRLYPPGWMFPRFAETDALVGGFRIPARAAMLMSPFVTHRDPAFWDRPDVFDPDRFSPERSAGRRRYAYFPFGGGARQCIGNNFATLEQVLAVAIMVRRVSLKLVPGQRMGLTLAASLRPRYGMKMRLESVSRSD